MENREICLKTIKEMIERIENTKEDWNKCRYYATTADGFLLGIFYAGMITSMEYQEFSTEITLAQF